jgi:hypothetical protein
MARIDVKRPLETNSVDVSIGRIPALQKGHLATAGVDGLCSLMGQGESSSRFSTPWDACVLCALAGA